MVTWSSGHPGVGELGARLDADPDLGVAVAGDLGPRAAAELVVEQGHIRDVDRAFLVDDPALRRLLGRLLVALDHRDLLDDHAIADDAQDLAALALVSSAGDDHHVALAYVRHD